METIIKVTSIDQLINAVCEEGYVFAGAKSNSLIDQMVGYEDIGTKLEKENLELLHKM